MTKSVGNLIKAYWGLPDDDGRDENDRRCFVQNLSQSVSLKMLIIITHTPVVGPVVFVDNKRRIIDSNSDPFTMLPFKSTQRSNLLLVTHREHTRCSIAPELGRSPTSGTIRAMFPRPGPCVGVAYGAS